MSVRSDRPDPAPRADRRRLRRAAAMMCVTALVPGCSFTVSIETPAVDKVDLQNELTTRLVDAGETPQSVSCSDDLEGVVGRTVRCSIEAADKAIDAIVEVTGVDGATVNFRLTPALTQPQLERAVADLVSRQTATTVESVTCQTGLEGKEGREAQCTIVGDGVTIPSTVKVTKVKGLTIDVDVTSN